MLISLLLSSLILFHHNFLLFSDQIEIAIPHEKQLVLPTQYQMEPPCPTEITLPQPFGPLLLGQIIISTLKQQF